MTPDVRNTGWAGTATLVAQELQAGGWPISAQHRDINIPPTDAYYSADFEESRICPIDQWENEGGPVIDRDIISGYGADADTTATDKLMSHEGLGISVGYAMTGEDYPD